ncbi:MAG: glycosyltransferase family 39 protein [Fimbriimonadaceae bacterium]|nr:glycosyltransferase family 39 protein [Fimbriimonadaceae bacterium]
MQSPGNPSETESPSLKPWLIVWFLAALPLIGWWLTGLTDVDEGFYGAVVSEMLRRGDWIIPHYNGSPWFEKPILLYWTSAPFMALFGPEFGARLSCVLATLGSYGLVAWFVRRHLGDVAARWSVIVLSSMFLMAALGRMMMADPWLILCLTGTFLFFLESLIGDKRYRPWAAAWLGFAVLAKGPVALIFFVIIAGIAFGKLRELRPNFKGGWLLGTVLLVTVIASWFLPAYLSAGEMFVQKFLVDQNLKRFAGGDAAHTLEYGKDPAKYLFAMFLGYPLILLLGCLPWSLRFFKALPKATDPIGTETAIRRFCSIWFFTILVFFSASGAKLPHYIAPACVPLAILIGIYSVRRIEERKLNPNGFLKPAIGAVFLCLLINSALWVWYDKSGQREAHALAREIKSDPNIALFRLPRLQKSLGTGKPRLQETSLPSLMMVMDRTTLQTEEFEKLLAAPKPLTIFTRENRITPEFEAQVLRAGFVLKPAPTRTKQDNFRVYILEQGTLAR